MRLKISFIVLLALFSSRISGYAQDSVTRIKTIVRGFGEEQRYRVDSTEYFYSGLNGSGQDNNVPYISDIADSMDITYKWNHNATNAYNLYTRRQVSYSSGSYRPDSVFAQMYYGGTLGWENHELTMNGYDIKGRDTLNAYFMSAINDWLFNYSYHYYYDPNDRLFFTKFRTLYNNVPEDLVYDSTYYDNQGRAVYRVVSDCNRSGRTWENTLLDSFYYDNADLLIHTKTFSWDNVNSKWIPALSTFNNYDGAGQRVATKYYSLAGGTNTYDGYDTVEYDANGYITAQWSYRHNINKWEYGPKHVYKYDDKYRLTKIDVYQWTGAIWSVGHPDSHTEWFYYETYRLPPVVSVRPDGAANENGFRCYPNPASNVLKLTISQPLERKARVLIYNMLGQLALSLPIPENQQDVMVPVSTLRNGDYIITVEGEGYTHRQKITVLR